MDKFDEKLEKYVKSSKKEPPTSYDFMVNDTLRKLPNKKSYSIRRLRTALATVCCSVFVITGFVFAKDVENFFYKKFHSMGPSISSAVQNGYITKSEMDLIEKDMILTNSETGEILDTIHTKAKIESAVVAGNAVGIELYFEFDSKLNEYVNIGKKTIDGNIDYENSHYFEFNDLFILDNENRKIVLAPDGEEQCHKYYETHNLDFDNYEVNRDGFSSHIGFIDNSDPNLIKTTIELTLGHGESLHSTKFYISFGELKLVPKITQVEKEIEVTMKSEDNWFLEIDIPEKMYDTSEEEYIVKNCENDNFYVYKASVDNTGFEIGIVVTNEEIPEYPTKLDDIANNMNPYNGEPTRNGYIEYYGEEYVNLYETYYKQRYLINFNGSPIFPWSEKTEGCYVLNSKGEKFETDYRNHKRTESPVKDKYSFNTVFAMTKVNATDKITVVIDFKGEPVKIELEKV